jgi:hypothetical protein
MRPFTKLITFTKQKKNIFYKNLLRVFMLTELYLLFQFVHLVGYTETSIVF